ncbi:helix-turn-helix transcriptional regulator [Vagococcus entomophilus]|uniref:Transcriptional regulator n=1 Tax=Vagococcus entomophilus TaxID=1160095 RepID=A0A430AHJ0_9ENTE|nr:helix-turn-helix transcriptional regulator [Vagococcus entomophilus]RSU07416.1 transcriptional regulator [Vagococcus entomophilus]
MQNKIQQLRKAKGLTQSELAEAVSVTRQTIISLESGRYNASLHLAHRIAKLFETHIEAVFIFDDEEDS